MPCAVSFAKPVKVTKNYFVLDQFSCKFDKLVLFFRSLGSVKVTWNCFRSMHSNKFETQIDTWTNDSAQNGDKDATIGGEWSLTNSSDALHMGYL